MKMIRHISCTLLLIVAIFESILIQHQALATDGLYVTNGNAILFLAGGNSAPITVYQSSFSRIVGLAFDASSQLLFWSDIEVTQHGIYQAPVQPSGNIGNYTIIVSTDIIEVNGLSVDWVAKNLYWTDSMKATVEVLNYGSTVTPQPRRILIMDGLVSPRGIVADPNTGYLFWNDQGFGTIERSYMDGSNRQLIVSKANYPNIKWPNQMVVYNSNLYWVDSAYKTLMMYSPLGGANSPITQVSSLAGPSLNNNIFGLSITSGTAYVSVWVTGQIIQVSLSNGQAVAQAQSLGTSPGSSISNVLFSTVYYSTSVQTTSSQTPVSSLCSSTGCSHLCLPNSTTAVRCSCPSYGAKVLKPSSSTVCQGLVSTDNILLYTLADAGYVGYYVTNSNAQLPITGERYLIGRSLRPVGVAIDPTLSPPVVYWSDVNEQTIHQSTIDGATSGIFLGSAQGIGVVDGMALDYVRKELYYSHTGSITIDSVDYTWQKIEAVQLTTPFTRRTVVTAAQKPRAIVLDLANEFMYYTDWGNRSRIVRTNMDGSSPIELRSGLNNPNGLALANGRLYYVDSNYKTRDIANYPGPPINGSLYSIALDGSRGFRQEIPNNILQIPYGLTSSSTNQFYISDWSLATVSSYTIANPPSVANPPTVQNILQGVSSPMMLLYTPYNLATNQAPACSCSDVCLTSPSSQAVCSCNSYNTNALGSTNTKCVPSSGFMSVGDMNSVKFYSLDGLDLSLYTAVQGQPYYANIVAVVYDPVNNTLYYSDINSKWIMSYVIGQSGPPQQFFLINHIIDGMTIDQTNRRLYWTDSQNGQILFLQLQPSGLPPASYTVVLTGLRLPRAIKISQNRYLYWTEWGTLAANRLSYLDLTQVNPTGPQSLTVYPIINANTGSPLLTWPNGLFIDDVNGRMYIGDGNPASLNIYNCSFSNNVVSSCQPVVGLSTTLKHVYDVYVYNNIVYYSDWLSSAIIAYSPQYQASRPILQSLMRPGQLSVLLPAGANNNNCGTNNGNCLGQGICVSILGGSFCTCPAGQTLSADDQRTCIINSQTMCNQTTTMTSYNPLYFQQFLPNSQTCINCQCLAGSNYYNDTVYGQAKCNRVWNCDTPTCGGDGSTTVNSNYCCPVCVSPCGIKITNCPQAQINLTMPAGQNYVVYDYLPSVVDCKHLSRQISFNRQPPGSVYNWTGSVVTVTMTATTVALPGTPTDTDTCTYYVLVQDTIAPALTCPPTQTLYTQGSTQICKWPPPQVTDNVGVTNTATNIQWGSSFNLGTTPVTYTVSDAASNTASCTFNVTVLTQTTGQCVVPAINNGQLLCSAVGSSLSCTIQCNPPAYVSQLSYSTIVCANEATQWTPVIPSTFTIATCIRPGPKAVSGSVTAIGRNACSPSIILSYTELYVEDRVNKNYLWMSTFPVIANTKVSGCNAQTSQSNVVQRKRRQAQAPAGSNDVTVVIVISGEYINDTDLPIITGQINAILRAIYQDFNRAFFILSYINNTGIYSSLNPDVSISQNATPGCLPGTIGLSSGYCGLCPTGMYTTDSVQCNPCNNGTYNDKEAQTQCPYCPSNYLSPQGSYISNFCTPPPSVPCYSNPTCIGPAVGLGGGGGLILLILLILLIVFLVRRRNKKKKTDNLGHALPPRPRGGGPKTYSNDAYESAGSDSDGSAYPAPFYEEVGGGEKKNKKSNTYQGLKKDNEKPIQYDSIK